ncbi:MAG: trigger factor [Fusobacteria bacterium]|nr:MAG: trigger factor [Fusobacteriota bacterium]
MNYEVKNLDNSVVEITLKVEGAEVADAKKKAIDKIAKDAEIPGFRKGHAPASAIESHYEGVIKEEVTDAILKGHYETILKDGNINPVDYIKTTDVKLDGDKFEVTFTVEVFPEIKLGEYKGLEATKESFEMNDELVNKEIEMMVSQKSSLEDAPEGHKAETGDTLDLAFEGFVDGVAFEGGKADSHMLKLGTKSFIDTFEDQLVGYEKGQEGEIKVTFPTEYHAENLAGKEATFKVKVNGIKVTKTPELNDEFAKEAGFESVEDLKAKKADEIKNREEKRIQGEYRQALLNQILANTEINLPESMITREVRGRIAEMENQLKSQGMNLEMYLQMSGSTMEQLTEQVRPMAIEKIKLDLILDEIAKIENIQLSEEELEGKLAEVASMYNMDVEKLKEELTKANNLENFKANLKIDATMQKTVEFIEEQAK